MYTSSLSSYVKTNLAKTYLLLTIFFSLLVFLIYFLANNMGFSGGIWFFVALSTVPVLISYYYSDKMILSMSGAKELIDSEHPKLRALVQKIAQKANIPLPKIYVMDSPALNAFATGRDEKNASVAFTVGILQALDEHELEGVVAHELSHIKNRDILLSTVVAVVVGGVLMLVDYLTRMTMLGRRDDDEGGSSGILLSLILMILVPILSTLIQLYISRQREFLADASGAKILGDGRGLAGALAKLGQSNHVFTGASQATAHLFITNPFGKSKSRFNIASWFATHPPLEERIAVLEKLSLK